MGQITPLIGLFKKIKLALKQRRGIVLVVDHAIVTCGTIQVSGWAIGRNGAAGIQQIDVTVNTICVGTANYGDARPDLKRTYPFVPQIGISGFHLYADLPRNIESTTQEYTIHITATGTDGRSQTQNRHFLNPYQHWIATCEPDARELERQRQTTFPNVPTISILTALSDVPWPYFTAMLDSVMQQTASNWELCLAGDMTLEASVRDFLANYAQRDSRLKLKFVASSHRRAHMLNEALALATGEFIAILEPADTLASFTLFEVTKYLNAYPETEYLYSDEDALTDDGITRYAPMFKPDWSPDFLRSTNYPGQFSVVKRALLTQIGGFHDEFEQNLFYDLILRITEQTSAIAHLPQVLYHRRIQHYSPALTLPNPSLNQGGARGRCSTNNPATSSETSDDVGQWALQTHLNRLHLDGKVKRLATPGYYQVTYALQRSPTISIIIPNRDHAADLQRCLNSILQQSQYRQFKILIVENGSREPETFRLYEHVQKHPEVVVLTWNQGFNYSAINNFAVRAARGEVVLFLNNDTEIISPDWLERMLEHALREEIGAVGAKLYYPDGTIQHAGLIVGVHDIAGHAHKFLPGHSRGYLGELDSIHNVSAVTAACVMMRKAVFTEIGGFDEQFQVDFNDIDLCLKLRERGYLIVWTPFAELRHFESKTRAADIPSERYPEFTREKALFRQRWQKQLDAGDPYYNPNLAIMDAIGNKKFHAKFAKPAKGYEESLEKQVKLKK